MSTPRQSAASAPRSLHRGTAAVLALIGFSAVVAQIVLMRELLVVFYGNEISLGLLLANWLLWTAFGSSVLGRWDARGHRPRGTMAALETLLAAVLPLTLVLLRLSRRVFHALPGEVLGPGAAFLTSFVALSLFCALSGWLFAAGARLYGQEAGAAADASTGSVYLLEALGSGIGGFLASVFFVRYLDSLQVAMIISLLNLLAAAYLVLDRILPRRLVMAAVLAVFAAVVFPAFTPRLETYSLHQLWRGFHLLGTHNSPYGNLAVIESEGSRSLVENGIVVATVPDPAAAEEAVHLALLQHAAPRRLLLIGGGFNGSIVQALQHPTLEQVDYVELDATVLRLAQQYFPTEWAAVGADARVHVHRQDGRLFLKTAPRVWDVIIVNLPEPQTAQLNRFYTVEFFREAAAHLAPGGLLSFQLRAAENYISPALADFLRCIHATLHAAFPYVSFIPGETVHFFAARQPGAANAALLLSRLRARHLQTEYVREYYLPFRMMPDRMLDLEQQIRPQPQTPINRDFAPIAYYFDVALWSGQFHQNYRRAFSAIARLRFGVLMAVSLCIALALVMGLRLRTTWQRLRTRAAAVSVASMGFMLIALEILLLLGFQAIYGYLYHQLAILTASFMLGLALGSWRGLRCRDASTALRYLVRVQAVAAISPLGLVGVLMLLAQQRTDNVAATLLMSDLLFPALALLSGMLGGVQFALATRVFFSAARAGAGTLYALDLSGACLGAILLSTYLVPVFGFAKVALLMTVITAPSALLLWAAQRGTPAR